MAFDSLIATQNVVQYFFYAITVFLFTITCVGIGANVFKRFSIAGGVFFVLVSSSVIFLISDVPSEIRSASENYDDVIPLIEHIAEKDDYKYSYNLIGLSVGLGLLVGGWIALGGTSKMTFELGKRFDRSFSNVPSNYSINTILARTTISPDGGPNVRIHTMDGTFQGVLDPSSVLSEPRALIIRDPVQILNLGGRTIEKNLGASNLIFLHDSIKRIETLTQPSYANHGEKGFYSLLMGLGAILCSAAFSIAGNDSMYLTMGALALILFVSSLSLLTRRGAPLKAREIAPSSVSVSPQEHEIPFEEPATLPPRKKKKTEEAEFIAKEEPVVKPEVGEEPEVEEPEEEAISEELPEILEPIRETEKVIPPESEEEKPPEKPVKKPEKEQEILELSEDYTKEEIDKLLEDGELDEITHMELMTRLRSRKK